MEAIVVLLQLMAEVAVACGRRAADDSNATKQARQRQTLVVVQDAVLLELHEYLSAAFGEVAKGECGIDVEHIERIAVLLVEVDLDLQLHLQALAECLACLLLEAQPYYIIVACPTGDASPSHDAVGQLVPLHKLAVEVTAIGGCTDVAQLAYHPVRLVETHLDKLAYQAVQLK